MAELTREQAALEEALPSKFTYLNDLEKYGYKGQKGFISETTYRDGRNVINVFFDGQDPKINNPVEVIPNGTNDAIATAFNREFPKPQEPSVPAESNVSITYALPDPSNPSKPQLGEDGKPLNAMYKGYPLPGAKKVSTLPDGRQVLDDLSPTERLSADNGLKAQGYSESTLGKQKKYEPNPDSPTGYDYVERSVDANGNGVAELERRQASLDELEKANIKKPDPKPPAVVNTAPNEKYIVRQMPDGTLSYEINPNYVGPDKFKEVKQDPKTGAWSGLNNQTGQWEPISGGPGQLTGPKGMAESHDSALADMRLGTVAKASQNYMTELLRRTSLPPNDPEFMTQEQASAAMTSFIAEGDQFLREQQGLLGEQNKVQTAQLTQRNQDLLDVQSRRNFQQTNVQQAAQHDTEVNKYLPAGSEHLAGPGFLGQIMLTNNLAGQYGGFDAVPQIQQTPMQSGLMGLPSFAVQDLGPGTIPGPPRTAPVTVNPQQPMPGIIAPQ